MISAVILTKNEEKNILNCLESLSWVDEIIIIDDYSTDLTQEVIRHYSKINKIKFFKKRLENDFSAQRNFALTKCKYDWVLFVDADEIVTNELRKEINLILINIKEKSEINGYFVKRKDIIWGKMLSFGETRNIKLLRLGNKNKGKWEGKVHEVWNILGLKDNLDGVLYHYPHQTVSEFLKELNFYTTLRAKELFSKHIKVTSKDIVFFPISKFVLNYFIKLGFLDGIQGIIMAIMMSFHSFLVRAKLWLLWKNT